MAHTYTKRKSGETMNEYLKMTDEELERLIAERKGYKAVEINGLWHITDREDDLRKWHPQDPENTDRRGKSTPEMAWEYGALNLPDWLGSTDEALALFPVGVLVITLTRFGTGNWTVDIPSMGYPRADLFEMSKSPSPARSVCLAWLVWKDTNVMTGSESSTINSQ